VIYSPFAMAIITNQGEKKEITAKERKTFLTGAALITHRAAQSCS